MILVFICTRLALQLTIVTKHCVTTYNGCFLLIKVFALMLFVFLFDCERFTWVIEGRCSSFLVSVTTNFIVLIQVN